MFALKFKFDYYYFLLFILLYLECLNRGLNPSVVFNSRFFGCGDELAMLSLRAVSYTHLDVYKRQDERLQTYMPT